MAIYNRGTKKKPNYMYRTYVGKDPVTGKDKYVSKSGFRNKKDAEFAELIIKRQVHNGEYLEPVKITFSRLVSQWIDHYSVDAKESSVRARQKAVNVAVNEFGEYQLYQITKNVYQTFIDNMSKKYSKNYVDSIHSSSDMAFQYAKEMKYIKEVPSDGVKRPKKRKTVEELENENIKEQFLEKHELMTFLSGAKEHGLDNDFVLFTLLAYSGCRIGELQALKWSDIDFKAHTIRITKTYYNPNNNKRSYKLTPPKTDSSIRTLSIDPAVIKLLQDHKNIQDELKQINHEFYVDNNFVFTGNEGYPMVYRTVADRMIRLMAMTDVKKHITPHSFRHSHVALLIEANVHIKEIQERCGHADIATTMNIYAAMTKDMKKEASTRFSNLMKDFSGPLLG